MSQTDVLTIAAIVLGPIAAVIITRIIDNLRERKQRRMDIFRTLMRTRRTPIFPEHVGALNLVEIEFSDSPTVIARLKDLLKHFGTEHVRRPDEDVSNVDDPRERQSRERKFYERLGTERASLLAKLLHEMSRTLKFKIDQLEIFEGGYTPQGWANVEEDQDQVRRFFAEIAKGNRILPIGVVDIRQQAQPEIEEPEK